ncbi:restriction endonuclease [Halorientalis marina]|uniref:restriction endonuclease n=1 Tax=Halorientalis marina TaxID=2931976 RepID=UPI001FF6F418|nr:restriction endonuclease [Halorientalis marina]
MLASGEENGIDDDELLTGTGSGGVFTSGYLRDRPLIEYLNETERVAFLLSNSKKGVREESDDDATAYTPGDRYQAIAAVTDTRVMFVVGDCTETDGDAMFAVPYTEIEDVKTGRGVLTKQLDVWTTSGRRWRFYVKSSVDLQPAADYLDKAAVVWSRVENQLGRAEEYVTEISAQVEDRSFEAAVETGARAREHVDEARRMATELTTNRADAVWERITDAEERLDAARMETHRTWAVAHEHEAERQWRTELYNQAYESYEAAREEYRSALDIARDQGFPEGEEIVAEIDDIRHDLDALSKSPLRRAEETRNRAAELDDPAVAVETWEEALERYQTTLVLDWGTDDGRFAGDSDDIRVEIEGIVDRIDETRRELADRHELTADDLAEGGEYERARREYAAARDQLAAAASVAEELRPSLVDGLRDRMDTLDERIEQARENAAANEFVFVGDTNRAIATSDAGADEDGDSLSGSVRERLCRADAETFRAVVASAWREMGWEATVLDDERDERVGVIAERSHPVPETQLLVTDGAPTDARFDAERVTNVAAAVETDYDADVVAFVTTGGFTDGARDAAAETRVKLIDGDHLASILETEGVDDFDPAGQPPTAD